MNKLITKTDWSNNSGNDGINKHELDFDKNVIDLKKYKLDQSLLNKFKSDKIYLKEEIKICKYEKCKLKSIEEFEFCYLHIDLFNKVKVACKWVNQETNERCDQPAFSFLNGTSSSKNDECSGLCLNHLALKKIKKNRQSSSVNKVNSSERKTYRLIRDESEYNPNDQQPTSTSILNFNNDIKNEFDELKLLREDTQYAEIRRENRKEIMKRLKYESKKISNKDILKSSSKKSKINLEEENIVNSSEESDEDENRYLSLVYKDKSNMDHDLNLLDSSDSLDQTMISLIKSSNPKLLGKDDDLTNGNESMADKAVEMDYENALNNAGVYTRDEVIKIFKCKLSKLQFLYKKQLAVLNDRLIYDRKKYLVIKKNEVEPIILNGENGENSSKSNNNKNKKIKLMPEDSTVLKASKKYQAASKKEHYLKQKYDPKNFSSKFSIFNQDVSVYNKCSFLQDNLKCSNLSLPSSKYCKEHILNDSHQVLFCECGPLSNQIGDEHVDKKSKNSEPTNHLNSNRCKIPIIASIQPKCPLHLANVEGLLTNDESAEMLKLNTNTFNSYNKNNKPTVPIHLINMANHYKEENVKIQKQLILDSLAVDETSSSLNLATPSNLNLNSNEPNLNSLVRIKQELVDSASITLNDDQEPNLVEHDHDDYSNSNSNVSNFLLKREHDEDAASIQSNRFRLESSDITNNLNDDSNRPLSPVLSNQAAINANKSSTSSASSTDTSSVSSSSTSSTSSDDSSDSSSDDSDDSDSDSESSTSSASSTSTEEKEPERLEEEIEIVNNSNESSRSVLISNDKNSLGDLLNSNENSNSNSASKKSLNDNQ